MKHLPLDPSIERVVTLVLDAVFRVHRELGPGLLESVYERCLDLECRALGLKVERQVVLPIQYRGHQLDDGLRIDLLIEDCVLVEVKSCEQLHPIHRAQTLTYLKLANLRLGLLINFNVSLIKDGIERIIR